MTINLPQWWKILDQLKLNAQMMPCLEIHTGFANARVTRPDISYQLNITFAMSESQSTEAGLHELNINTFGDQYEVKS